MKNNKTESEIFEQIKASLERYEEAYIPGSWENFLQKRKNNNRKIFLRIASGIAACLIVGFLGVNYFQDEQRYGSVVTAEQTAGKFQAQPEVENDFAKNVPPSEGVTENVPPSEGVAKNVTPSAAVAKNLTSSGEVAKNVTPSEGVAESGIKRPDEARGKTAGLSTLKKSGTTEGEGKITGNQMVSVPATATAPANQVAALQVDVNSQSSVNKPDTAKNGPDTTKVKTQNMFLTTPQAIDNPQLAAAQKRKVRFGVNFSPGVSTTESSSSLNYMGGISADISLSSKVALSTGMQFENQSFVKKMPGIVASANVPVNQTKTTLINLDFPVNVTWKFAAEKTHAYYVSAGLSSLVYLSQENKNTTYSQSLVPVESMVNGDAVKSYSLVNQVSVTRDAVTPAQPFDLAGRVNLMVGYEKKLSNRIYIHFEPYAKFPTSSQEAGSLNHTTTGINFKISF